ncbi:MAG: radical SAM protein [Coriobacteriaceae bacterium]
MSTFLNDSPVFGPVHSRRLGISLGLNLMPSTRKICTFDCIYCENGFNESRKTDDTYVDLDEFRQALEQKLKDLKGQNITPDVLTFAGNGEPTESPIFPEAVDAAIKLRDAYAPSAKIAVLSNGTCAGRPEVHRALLKVDDNILKLDTVDPQYIRMLDRPQVAYDIHHQIQTFASFDGHAIIQTIFLRGTYNGRNFDNTSQRFVQPWLEALKEIKPSRVTVYTIARDTPAPSLEKAPKDVLDKIAKQVKDSGIACSVSY